MRPAAILLALTIATSSAAAEKKPLHVVDHVGLGCADLDRGVAVVEERTSVRAETGGVHPGRGTHNALMTLGHGTYLEIIAPVAGGAATPDNAELAALATPKPVFFAVGSTDLAATAALLKAAGFATSEIRAGSRKKPDGSVLEWRTLRLEGKDLGAAPFFIEWTKGAAHPSATSPKGCTLAKLEVESESPERLSRLFEVLGLDVPVRKAAAPGLRVRMLCPKGEVSFGP